MGRVPCPVLQPWKGRFSWAHGEPPGVAPGEQNQSNKQRTEKHNRRLPSHQSPQPEVTAGKSSPAPVPTRTSAIKTAAAEEKQTAPSCLVHGKQRSATGQMQPRHHRQAHGRTGKAQKTFFSTVLSLLRTERRLPRAREKCLCGAFFPKATGSDPVVTPTSKWKTQARRSRFCPPDSLCFTPHRSVFIEGN